MPVAVAETPAVAPAPPPPVQALGMDQLVAGGHPFLHLEAALAEDYGSASALPLRYDYAWQHLNRGRHAELALRAGAMQCADPITGELLGSTQAFVLPGNWLCIVYRFAGRESFDLVTSSFDQAKLGLSFPARRLFIAGRVDPTWAQLGAEAAADLQRLQGDAVHRPAAPGASHAAALHLGFGINLGHFLWNDLSGLETVVDSGALAQVGSIELGPRCFFPVEQLFPEIAAAGVPVRHWPKPVPACVAYGDSLPLRVAGNRISRGLRRRVVAWALQEERDNLATLAAFNGPGLNLWFNLRLHNKTWVDQVDGIAALARAVQRSLPPGQPLRLIMDGTPDTAPLVEQIARQLAGVAQVLDATQMPLARSIVLCALADLHVCVVGSGLMLPHWVMGRRGVAHSNRAHLLQQRFWNNVAEGTHDVLFVPAAAVTDLDPAQFPEPSYVNYRLDAGVLLERLDTLHRQLDTGPRRSGYLQMQQLAAQGRWADAAERLISV